MSQPPPLARTDIEFLRSLMREPSARKAASSFIIEGTHLLERAIESDPKRITSAYFTERAKEKNPTLFSQIRKKNIEISMISAKQSEKISETSSPQGVFACIIIQEAETHVHGEIVIALEGVQDPGNMGTIIRTAAWFGVKSLIVGGTSVDVFAPKTLRATQGEIFSITCVRVDRLSEQLRKLKKNGYRILTTTLEPTACSIYRERFKGKMVVIFGSESQGVTPETLADSDGSITIPKLGSGESLNVAMSAAIVLSEVARQKTLSALVDVRAPKTRGRKMNSVS